MCALFGRLVGATSAFQNAMLFYTECKQARNHLVQRGGAESGADGGAAVALYTQEVSWKAAKVHGRCRAAGERGGKGGGRYKHQAERPCEERSDNHRRMVMLPSYGPQRQRQLVAARGGSVAALLCSVSTESSAAAAVGVKALGRRPTFRYSTHPPVLLGAEAIKKKAELYIAAARTAGAVKIGGSKNGGAFKRRGRGLIALDVMCISWQHLSYAIASLVNVQKK